MLHPKVLFSKGSKEDNLGFLITESFRLENASKIIGSDCSSSTANPTPKPCPSLWWKWEQLSSPAFPVCFLCCVTTVPGARAAPLPDRAEQGHPCVAEISCRATQVSQGPLLLCRVTENRGVFVSLKPFLQFLKALRRGAGCANPLLSIHLPVLPERSDVEQRRCLFPKKKKKSDDFSQDFLRL